jgi:hypothetical protein
MNNGIIYAFNLVYRLHVVFIVLLSNCAPGLYVAMAIPLKSCGVAGKARLQTIVGQLFRLIYFSLLISYWRGDACLLLLAECKIGYNIYGREVGKEKPIFSYSWPRPRLTPGYIMTK